MAEEDSRSRTFSVALIGVGGIGSVLLPPLAKLEWDRLTLWDDDTVQEGNLKNQLIYRPEDLGKGKAKVAGEWVRGGSRNVVVRCEKYINEEFFDSVVISAVDSIQSRRLIWEGVKRSKDVQLFLDGRLTRMFPLYAQLFIINPHDPESCEIYEETLIEISGTDLNRQDPDMVPAPVILSGLITTILLRWGRGAGNFPWQVVWDGVSFELATFF